MSGHMGKLLYCLCLTRRRGLHIVRDHFFSKSHLSLIPSLLLSKCDPLRWARIWCLDADLEVAASILFTLDNGKTGRFRCGTCQFFGCKFTTGVL